MDLTGFMLGGIAKGFDRADRRAIAREDIRQRSEQDRARQAFRLKQLETSNEQARRQEQRAFAGDIFGKLLENVGKIRETAKSPEDAQHIAEPILEQIGSLGKTLVDAGVYSPGEAAQIAAVAQSTLAGPGLAEKAKAKGTASAAAAVATRDALQGSGVAPGTAAKAAGLAPDRTVLAEGAQLLENGRTVAENQKDFKPGGAGGKAALFESDGQLKPSVTTRIEQEVGRAFGDINLATGMIVFKEENKLAAARATAAAEDILRSGAAEGIADASNKAIEMERTLQASIGSDKPDKLAEASDFARKLIRTKAVGTTGEAAKLAIQDQSQQVNTPIELPRGENGRLASDRLVDGQVYTGVTNIGTGRWNAKTKKFDPI